MKQGFVHTENYRRLLEAQAAVERRGAAEAGLVIIRGPYGVGKSEIVERWSADTGALFLRAKETWTKRSMLDELADLLGLDIKGRNSEVQARIIGRQAIDMTNIVIDEADFLLRGRGSTSTAALLECLRDITDVTGIACFLVGMEQFGDRVARHGHIASRVNRVVNFEPLSSADIKAACKQKCEVKLGDGVAELIASQVDGKMRLVLNALSNIEQIAEANSLDQVEVEHLKGRALCVEFKSGAVRRGGAQ
ncbi:AAA family ATPase [Burkholderiaceae bacterium UC74_6]